jgi:four helix bundle protein
LKDFRKQKVWVKAHGLTLEIYKVTEMFPKEELFGLTRQIRRSCSSIPANIAEGCGRDTDADFARFLQISMGSASELEYHLLLAHDLGLLQKTEHENLQSKASEIKLMLTSFIKKLKADRGKLTTFKKLTADR